jgi:hypothetical protein
MTNINEVYKMVLSECQQMTDEAFEEMDKNMEESGMAQGEIESCINHWKNKYIVIKK